MDTQINNKEIVLDIQPDPHPGVLSVTGACCLADELRSSSYCCCWTPKLESWGKQNQVQKLSQNLSPSRSLKDKWKLIIPRSRFMDFLKLLFFYFLSTVDWQPFFRQNFFSSEKSIFYRVNIFWVPAVQSLCPIYTFPVVSNLLWYRLWVGCDLQESGICRSVNVKICYVSSFSSHLSVSNGELGQLSTHHQSADVMVSNCLKWVRKAWRRWRCIRWPSLLVLAPLMCSSWVQTWTERTNEFSSEMLSHWFSWDDGEERTHQMIRSFSSLWPLLIVARENALKKLLIHS